jgi:hypothetical protein
MCNVLELSLATLCIVAIIAICIVGAIKWVDYFKL